MNPAIIWLIIRIVIWIVVFGLGFFYLYSALGGASLTYNSLNDFLIATGACSVDGNCDIAGSACFLCPYIENLFYLISSASVAMYNILISQTWILLVMGFAIYILFHTLSSLNKGLKDNEKLDTKERKIDDFKSYFEPIRKQGIRLLIIGAILGAFSVNKIGSMKLIADLTINPILSIGNYVAMDVTNIPEEYCPSLMDTESVHTPQFLIDSGLSADLDASVLAASVMNPFLCTIGNVNTVLLAGVSGGFSLMNFGWMDGSLFVWIAGFALIIILMMVGFHLIFDLMNIVFSMAFLIMFLPLIIASYAFPSFKVLAGLGPNSISILVNAMVNTILLAIRIIVLYVMIFFTADKYFPGPLDNYSAVFPPMIALNMSNEQANSDSEQPQLAQIMDICADFAKQEDGTISKDKFKDCYIQAQREYPGDFDWMQNNLEFFLTFVGILLLYYLVIEKKIKALFGDREMFFKFGTNVYDISVGGFKKILDIGDKIFFKKAK